MRRAAKVDGNHSEIVAALRGIGCSVLSLAPLGVGGVPDLLVSRSGRTMLFEIKCGKGELSDLQKIWHRNWQGDVFVVRDAGEAVRIMDFWTR